MATINAQMAAFVTSYNVGNESAGREGQGPGDVMYCMATAKYTRLLYWVEDSVLKAYLEGAVNGALEIGFFFFFKCQCHYYNHVYVPCIFAHFES